VLADPGLANPDELLAQVMFADRITAIVSYHHPTQAKEARPGLSWGLRRSPAHATAKTGGRRP